MKRLVAAVIGVAGLAGLARAEVELGGTTGLRVFNDDSGFGVEDHPEADSQKNTALFGIRLSVFFGERFGVEAEAGVIPSEGRAMLYDVWNLTYRASFVAQFRAERKNRLVPIAFVGGGVHTILSSTNEDAIAEDSAPVPHAGGGVKYRTGTGVGVRLDARVLLPPSSASKSVTTDFEILVGIYRDFGYRRPPPVSKPLPPPPPPKDEDPDRDGIVGAADRCANEAEDRDGFKDDDGCPDDDNDDDGVADAADGCPNDPEDKDGFKDDDGCRELDNDEDGVLDLNDRCQTEQESRNGYIDDDGCADEVPEKLRLLTGAPQAVAFRPNTAELAPGAAKLLDAAAAVLLEVKEVAIEVGVHTDDQPPGKGGKFADNQALSQARADAVKAYLVGKGLEEGRLAARGHGDSAPLESPQGLAGPKLEAARAKNRRVELKLVIAQSMAVPAPEPAPMQVPAPAPPPTPPTPTPTPPAPAPAPPAP